MKARLLVLCVLLSFPLAAQAQYANEPYFESQAVMRHAHALDLMAVRLEALEAVAQAEGELPEELVEQAEDLLGADLPRIAGSLARADAERLRQLRETLTNVETAVAEGDTKTLAEGIQRVREEILRARELLLAGALDSPPIAAASMSRLLLGEPGVAEGYEEATLGERWEYTLGWAALQRVEEIWAVLSPDLAGRSDEVREALDQLAELLPGPIPPELIQGDPEAGEEPAHRITGLLEGIVDANLYPERELGRVAEQGAEQAARACVSFEMGDEELGMELSLSVRDIYESISGTVGMLAAEAHEQVESALRDMVGGGDDAAEGGQSSNGGEDDSLASAENGDGGPQELTTACSDLQEGLQEIARAFGG